MTAAEAPGQSTGMNGGIGSFTFYIYFYLADTFVQVMQTD